MNTDNSNIKYSATDGRVSTRPRQLTGLQAIYKGSLAVLLVLKRAHVQWLRRKCAEIIK